MADKTHSANATVFVAAVNKEIGVVWDGLSVKVWNDAIKTVYDQMWLAWSGGRRTMSAQNKTSTNTVRDFIEELLHEVEYPGDSHKSVQDLLYESDGVFDALDELQGLSRDVCQAWAEGDNDKTQVALLALFLLVFGAAPDA